MIASTVVSELIRHSPTQAFADPGTLRLVLSGAAPDTGNMGVSALCHGTLGALHRRIPDARVSILDFGWGVRSDIIDVDGADVIVERCGARHSRRLYRSDTLWNIRVSAQLGGLWNPAARRLLGADAVLDISGGDSFTDLYGPSRFESVAYAKRIALENGIPLVMLPQTYGPFRTPRARAGAARMVRGCRLAIARDHRSYEALKDLAGASFEPSRHRVGVDVAFLLAQRPPQVPLPGPVQTWIERPRSAPVVGFNVSGLIYNDPSDARARFGFRADYRIAVVRILNRLLADGSRVVLVPHVLTPPGHYESDVGAADAIKAAISSAHREQIQVLPARYDQSELKWLIAQMDWFCGTRMHATIAALSSGVPTAAIAYSGKTLGVFETCGQEAEVIDPRTLDTDEVVERVWQSWQRRDQTRASLAARLPAVFKTANEQMDLIAGVCTAAAAERRSSRA